MVGRVLVAVFEAEQDLVVHAACRDLPDQTALDQKVLPVGRIDIGGQRHRAGLAGRGPAGEDVAVEFFVVAVEDRGRDLDVVRQCAVQPELDDAGFQRGAVHARDAEEPVAVAGDRHPGEGGDAAICDAVVVDIFVRQSGLPTRAQVDREIGVHGVSLTLEIVPVVVERFDDGIDPQGGTLTERGIDVGGEVPGTEAVGTCPPARRCAAEDGCFLHPVYDPASAASPEDQGIGALQHFNPFQIVQAPEILAVVPDSVEEKVGRGILSSQGDLVAIALALADRGAGHIAQHVAEALLRLIIQLGTRHDRDRLGHVDQQGVCPGRGH